jgi:hypothetical protein
VQNSSRKIVQNKEGNHHHKRKKIMQAKKNWIYCNGDKVHQGACVQVDHTLQTFTVVIRSTQTNIAERVKQAIQEKFEVVILEQTEETNVCVR